MTKREQEQRRHMMNALEQLGFSFEEREALRRISMTLHSWFERECGTDNGCIERDETTNKTYWLNSHSGKRYPIRDMETGAMRRLKAIMGRVNLHERHGDLPDGSGADRAGALSYYIQGDCRGASLYILRPSDVPAGQRADGYYTRGICVY